MFSSLLKCALVVTLLFSLTVIAQQPQTIGQGVYTDGQANRGQALYKEQCASCHGDALGGRLAPPLTGDDFIADWDKEPLSALFNKIKNTMPQKDPDKLTAQQTTDIVAHILRTGKFPAGRAELRGETADLEAIKWPAANRAAARPAASSQTPAFPPAGNLAQVMRGILFPSSNIIFTVQTIDPAEKKKPNDAPQQGGFNWMTWGGDIYPAWEVVDYAAVALAESAPLMLTPGRKCENGKPVPVNDPEWIQFTNELAEAGRAAYKASQTRNQEKVSDVTNVIADACLHCHQVYRDRRASGLDPVDPANRATRCAK